MAELFRLKEKPLEMITVGPLTSVAWPSVGGKAIDGRIVLTSSSDRTHSHTHLHTHTLTNTPLTLVPGYYGLSED